MPRRGYTRHGLEPHRRDEMAALDLGDPRLPVIESERIRRELRESQGVGVEGLVVRSLLSIELPP